MIEWRLDYLQLNLKEYEDLPAVITLSRSFSLLFRPTPSTELLKLLSSSFLGTVLNSSSSLHACSCYYRVLWCFPSPILWRIILDWRINSHQDWQAANSLLLSRTFMEIEEFYSYMNLLPMWKNKRFRSTSVCRLMASCISTNSMKLSTKSSTFYDFTSLLRMCCKDFWDAVKVLEILSTWLSCRSRLLSISRLLWEEDIRVTKGARMIIVQGFKLFQEVNHIWLYNFATLLQFVEHKFCLAATSYNPEKL